MGTMSVANYGALLASTSRSKQVVIPSTAENILSGYMTTSNQTDADGLSLNNIKYNFFAGTGKLLYDTEKTHFGHGTLRLNNGGNSVMVRPSVTDALFDVGTSNFCFEIWVSLTQSGILFSWWSSSTASTRRSFNVRADSSNQVTMEYRDTGSTTIKQAICIHPTVNLYDGQFHHIVVQRRSNFIEVYIDGYLGATRIAISASNGVNVPSVYAYPCLGGYSDGQSFDTSDDVYGTLYGWISEFRVSKVTRYNGTFTPPTSSFPKRAADDPYFSSVNMVLVYNRPCFITLTGTEKSKITNIYSDYIKGVGTNATDNGNDGMYVANGMNNRKIARISANNINPIAIGSGEDCCIELVFYTSGNGITLGNSGQLYVTSAGDNYTVNLTVGGTSHNFLFSIPETSASVHIAVVRKNGGWYRVKNGTWIDSTPLYTNNNALTLINNNPLYLSGETASSQLPNGNDLFSGFRFTRYGSRFTPGVGFTPPTPMEFVTT